VVGLVLQCVDSVVWMTRKGNIHKGRPHRRGRGVESKVDNREGGFNGMQMSAFIVELPTFRFCYSGMPMFDISILVQPISIIVSCLTI